MLKKLILAVAFLHINCFAATLGELATKYQTDKRPGDHDYPKSYTKHFESLRNRKLQILEIGFGEGRSGNMWLEYFPRSQYHSIDINPLYVSSKRKEFAPRGYLYLVDQSSREQLEAFAKKFEKPFDIIIDDGSHVNSHQILTFKTMFPYLKSGGCYVIEDLHTSYWKIYGGTGEHGAPKANELSCITFLQSLIHDINYLGAYTGYADRERAASQSVPLNYFQKQIASIHFYSSICFIYKK